MRKALVLFGLLALAAAPLAASDCPHAKAAQAATAAAEHDGCMSMAGVERTVTNLDNGVRVEMTAKDAKVLEALQSKATAKKADDCKDCPMHAEGVTRSVEKTANGVVLTATATTPEMAKKLQSYVTAKIGGKGCSKGTAAAAGCNHGEAPAKS